jgi:hypothetical protein
MATKTISGTITTGYTLSPTYSALTITGSGSITGSAGATGVTGQPGGTGGVGLTVTFAASIGNSGHLHGGQGGAGADTRYANGRYYYSNGGTGGAAVYLKTATLSNTGSIVGGYGGVGSGEGNYFVPDGAGGAGGAGVIIAAGASLTNSAFVHGGLGGLGGGSATFYGVGNNGGNGGDGVDLRAGGKLANAGTIIGGYGASGGFTPYASGLSGAGGAGVVSAATGGLTNTGLIQGGAGAASQRAGGQTYYTGSGGAGGVGLQYVATGNLTNMGRVIGGAGGAGPGYASGVAGGQGGAGLDLASGGVVTNNGSIIGGTGGTGGGGAFNLPAGAGGGGGAGLALNATGVVINNGLIEGGAGGQGGSANYGGDGGGAGTAIVFSAGGTLRNAGSIVTQNPGAGGAGQGGGPNGSSGAQGDGVLFQGAGSIVNGSASALIKGGAVGVYGAGGGALTLTNAGTISGGSGVSVQFNASADRLIVDAGSTWVGSAQGGGGTLELASGTSTVSGLGSSATLSGGEAMLFNGFGAYVIDSGASLSLTGTNTLGADQTLTNFGQLNGKLTLGQVSDRVAVEAGSKTGLVVGGGGALELGAATGVIQGLGATITLSGGASGQFTGFGSYDIDAGSAWTLSGNGALAASQTLNDAGYLTVTGSLASAGQIIGGVTTNQGTVASLGYISSGVGMNGGQLINGSASVTSALITSSAYAIYANTSGPASVINFGTILETGPNVNGTGVWLNGGGDLTNGSASDGKALISGYYGVYIGVAGVGTVTNYGAIDGVGGHGVELNGSSDRLIAEAGSSVIGLASSWGGTLELASGVGVITGLGATGTISGSEAMTFSGFGTYQLDAGTNVTLAGASNLGSPQSLALAAGAALTNKGTLTSAGTLMLSGKLSGPGTLAISGGTASIGAGAVLTVPTVSLTGGAISLTENLTFKGAFTEGPAATVTLGSKNKLTLSGAATLGGLINGAGTVVVANATVSGLTIGGTDVLSDTGKATQTGSLTIGDATTAKASLSIASGATWTINGAVGISHGASTGSTLKVGGALIKSGATGTSIVNLATTDTGVIEAAAGTLDMAGKLAGTGVLKIDTGATLEVDTTAASTLTATFDGGAATLALKSATTFGATISGFAVGDTIDLLGKKATGASINASDQLVIVNGTKAVATLQLTGTYSGATFSVGSDGNHGTDVTLLTAAKAPSPSGLIAAMAALGGGVSGSAASRASPDVSLNATRLSAPRAH